MGPAGVTVMYLIETGLPWYNHHSVMETPLKTISMITIMKHSEARLKMEGK